MTTSLSVTDVEQQSKPEAGDINKAVIAASVGTIIEWFDYALYGAASGLIISKLFFSSLSATAGLFAAFATFAVGYFIRPLGGVVISHLGDRYGRKPALILTIVLMGAATVAMGLLPTYENIGVAAPILLVLLRMAQGFGAGAELAGAIVLVAEYAPVHRRAFYTSLPNGCALIGIMLATGAFLVVSWLPEEAMLGWAWRIPFLLSGVLFLVALYIRKNLDETPAYKAAMKNAEQRHKAEAMPLKQLFRESPKEVLYGFLSVSGHNANLYLLSAFSISYMVTHVGIPRSDSLMAGTIASLSGVFAVPLFGCLADRIGSAKVFTIGIASIFLLAIPVYMAMDTGNFVLITLGMAACYIFGFGATAGAQGAFLANLFPTRYRFSGLTASREFNGVLIAGPTPLIASALVNLDGGSIIYVAIYLMACCSLSFYAISMGKHRSVHT